MIFPLIFYCNNVFLVNSISRFETNQNRSYKIVHTTKNACPWISVQNERKRRTAVDVFKFLNNIHIPKKIINISLAQIINYLKYQKCALLLVENRLNFSELRYLMNYQKTFVTKNLLSLLNEKLNVFTINLNVLFKSLQL